MVISILGMQLMRTNIPGVPDGSENKKIKQEASRFTCSILEEKKIERRHVKVTVNGILVHVLVTVSSSFGSENRTLL